MKYLLLFVAAIALAQTVPEVSPIAGKSSVDNSAATEVKPVPNVTALPGTCAVGDQVFKTNATAGQNLYACTSTNTWTVQTGASAAAIGGTITGATDGSILFAHPGAVFAQDNANFFWNSTNHCLNIAAGTNCNNNVDGLKIGSTKNLIFGDSANLNGLAMGMGGTNNFTITNSNGNAITIETLGGLLNLNPSGNGNIDIGGSDLGIHRNAAGVLEINNGTPGTFRDLLGRSLISSNATGQEWSMLSNSSNEYFVHDLNNNKTPFTIQSNSPSCAIYTFSSGNVALNNACAGDPNYGLYLGASGASGYFHAGNFSVNASGNAVLGTPASGNASNLSNLPITLTTTGSSGASTYTQATNTLNIPNYTAGAGTVTVVGAGSLGSTQIVTGGGTTTIQTPSSAATVDSSGNIKGTSIATGATPPSSSVCTAGTAGFDCLGEGTTPTGTLSGTDVLWANSSTHRLDVINNNGTNQQVVVTGGDINTSDQVTVTHLAAALPANQGGIGSTSVPTAGQIPTGNAGGTAYAPVSMSQDCTMTSAGVITCTKSNNVSLSFMATATGALNPQTATYQVLAADFTNLKTINVASGTFTITLVASGTQPPTGQYIDIVNYGSGVVTIARSGQNINGGTTSLTLNAGSATAPSFSKVWSDGTNYFAAVSNPSSGGSSTVLIDSETLSASQIKALGTGGSALALSGALGTVPGSGKFYEITGIVVEYVCSACTAMSGAGHFILSYDTGGNYDPLREGSGQYPGVDGMLGSTTAGVGKYYSNENIGNGAYWSGASNVVNQKLYFVNGGSAFTTGTGSLIIDISYVIHSGF